MIPSDFLNALKKYNILDEAKCKELLPVVQDASLDVRTLTQRLIQSSDLTPYQADQLLQGRGDDLLLGSYVLLQPLGEGGMGAVFKARNWKFGQICALKIIRKDRIDNVDTIRRFEREIRAASQLDHTNIVRALDADEVDGTHLLVMEYVEGDDLAKVVKENGPLPIKTACDFIRQTALGLQHAYETGLVHRDIKPNNLLVTNTSRDGEGACHAVVKILDMGLARIARRDGDAEASSTMTQKGMVIGTLDYIAPEQAADAHSADIRSDIYSLGCTFYVLLTGRVPFPGGDVISKLMRHKTEEPRPVEELRPDVPEIVAAVVRQMMAKEPEQRFETPGELADALEQFLTSFDNVETVTHHPTPVAANRLGDAPDASVEPIETSGHAITASRAGVAALSTPKGKRETIGWRRLSVAGGGLVGIVAFAVILRVILFMPSSPPPKRVTNSIGMKLVLIPAGKFTMGSPATEKFRGSDEGPQHVVHISKSFYVGVYEVTQAQYQRVMGTNPSRFSSSGFGKNKVAGMDTSNFPVERVHWRDAVEFCKKLSDLPKERAAGRVYRLPSEAEWEYTCRGGATSYQVFHFGNTLTADQANCGSEYPGKEFPPLENSLGRTTSVGSYQPNAFGVYDMHGNVWEWCADLYNAQYYNKSPVRDPLCLTGGRPVSRGGSWDYYGSTCRAASRNSGEPNYRESLGTMGFRVVCVPSGK